MFIYFRCPYCDAINGYDKILAEEREKLLQGADGGEDEVELLAEALTLARGWDIIDLDLRGMWAVVARVCPECAQELGTGPDITFLTPRIH